MIPTANGYSLWYNNDSTCLMFKTEMCDYVLFMHDAYFVTQQFLLSNFTQYGVRIVCYIQCTYHTYDLRCFLFMRVTFRAKLNAYEVI